MEIKRIFFHSVLLSLHFLKALIKKGRNSLYVPDLFVPTRMYNHINDCYARFIWTRIKIDHMIRFPSVWQIRSCKWTKWTVLLLLSLRCYRYYTWYRSDLVCMLIDIQHEGETLNDCFRRRRILQNKHIHCIT